MGDRAMVLARVQDARRSAHGFAALRGLTAAPGPGPALRAMAVGGASASRKGRGRVRGETNMLRIHDVMLEAIVVMRPVLPSIERHDRDLASQLRRAASSVALNVAEGSGSAGGVRLQRYRTALGSAREVWSCLRVAQAAGYVAELPASLPSLMNRIIGTLVRVTT